MTNPIPSFFFNLVRYASCLSYLVQLFVADLVWLEYLEDPTEVSCLSSFCATQNRKGNSSYVCYEYPYFGLGPDAGSLSGVP